MAFIFVYVDDMLLAALSLELLSRLKRQISQKWSITNLSEVSHYLSIKVQYDREAGILLLNQEAYIEKIAVDFNLLDKAPSITPISGEPQSPSELHKASSSAVKLYQSLIGSQIYAMTVSRPNVAYALSALSRFLMNLDDEHLHDAQRAGRYLFESKRFALRFTRLKTETETLLGLLKGYVDASYASCPDTRRSRTGYIFFLAGGPIAWTSQRQKCVTKSTAEAEYLAISDAGSEAIWLTRLLKDLLPNNHPQQSRGCILHTDSKSALAIINNQKTHGRTRHIDIHWHWIREAIQTDKFSIMHVPGATLVADGLTKALPGPKFKQFFSMLSTGGTLTLDTDQGVPSMN